MLKTEPHLHTEGILEPEPAFEPAAENCVELSHATVEDLRKVRPGRRAGTARGLAAHRMPPVP